MAGVTILIQKNEDAETYRVSFGVFGGVQKIMRYTLDRAEQIAQDLYDEVKRQKTGTPRIVRDFS